MTRRRKSEPGPVSDLNDLPQDEGMSAADLAAPFDISLDDPVPGELIIGEEADPAAERRVLRSIRELFKGGPTGVLRKRIDEHRIDMFKNRPRVRDQVLTQLRSEHPEALEGPGTFLENLLAYLQAHPDFLKNLLSIIALFV